MNRNSTDPDAPSGPPSPQSFTSSSTASPENTNSASSGPSDLFQANVLSLLLKVRMISPELVERMRVVGIITQAPVIRKILDHIGRRFNPLKLPGRAPPLGGDFFPDPFPDHGPQ